jgi:hypothetical protein
MTWRFFAKHCMPVSFLLPAHGVWQNNRVSRLKFGTKFSKLFAVYQKSFFYVRAKKIGQKSW